MSHERQSLNVLDQAVLRVEEKMKSKGFCGVPGTTFSRVLMDTKLCAHEGITIPKGKEKRESILVWCCGLGAMEAPKLFGYGLTMMDALSAVVAMHNGIVKSKRDKI